MNGLQFDATLAKLRPGGIITYHVGLLMHDRCYDIDADSVGRAAWQASLDGIVALFQRRVSPNACQYIAVKVRNAPKPTK